MEADKDWRVEEGNSNSKKDKQCSRESMRERMRETDRFTAIMHTTEGNEGGRQVSKHY